MDVRGLLNTTNPRERDAVKRIDALLAQPESGALPECHGKWDSTHTWFRCDICGYSSSRELCAAAPDGNGVAGGKG